MAVLLSLEDQHAIRDAVARAEEATSGEIFVVVAGESDDYRFVPLAWATLAALIVPLPLILLTSISAALIYGIQLGVFIVALVVLTLPPVKAVIVPQRMKAARTRALAVQQFLAHGLHMTEARTGILIFVSLAERHAEIVADAGIAAKVDQATWDAAMADLVAAAAADDLVNGLIGAVRASGAILATHFPPGRLNRNELPNDVVIL